MNFPFLPDFIFLGSNEIIEPSFKNGKDDLGNRQENQRNERGRPDFVILESINVVNDEAEQKEFQSNTELEQNQRLRIRHKMLFVADEIRE